MMNRRAFVTDLRALLAAPLGSWRRHEITFRPAKFRGESCHEIPRPATVQHPYLPPYSPVARRYSPRLSRTQKKGEA